MRSIFWKSALLVLIIVLVNGCASSGSTRVAASEADKVYIKTEQSLTHPGGDLRDAIQDTNQETKGIVLGGLTGALIGSIYSSSIGVLPGLAGGAIIGGAIGSYVDSYTTPIDRLINRGVQVIVLGDQVKFVIPSYVIFNNFSAVLRPYAYSTLDQVADVISRYKNMSIRVAAFTSNTGPPNVNLALSQQQANCVAKYLSTRGVNTRLIYATGLGGAFLVSQNVSDWSNDNYRVEITLEKLPP